MDREDALIMRKKQRIKFRSEINLVKFARLINNLYEKYEKQNNNFWDLLFEVSEKLSFDKSVKEALDHDIVKNLNRSNRDWNYFCKVISGNDEDIYSLAIRMMDNIDYAIDGSPNYKMFRELFFEANNELTSDMCRRYDYKLKKLDRYPKYIKFLTKAFQRII